MSGPLENADGGAAPGRAGAGGVVPLSLSGATSLTTRLSYAASDVAGQLVFAFISFYLLYFYTEVYGLSPGVAGTILLAARLIDALDAPIWGIVFERTRSPWGKSRPWFLWLCVPFATFGVLTFLTPDLSGAAKIVYASVTYVITSILYTGINTPVTSILAALTPEPRERVVLTCFRMFGSKLGVLAVNLTALRAVEWLGAGDDRRGFMLAMPLYAVACVALYLVAFRNLREVVPVEHTPQPLLGSFGALRGNWPWLILFAGSFWFWVAFIARVSAAPYFFEYTLGRKDLIPAAFALDFVSLATVLFLPWFCRKTSKRNVWALGLLGMIAGQLVMAWGVQAGLSLPWIMAGWTLGFLASGVAMAMPFALLSDSVDYGEWRTGIRAAGLLTAIGAAFCLKAGAGLGGALPGWMLEASGYAAGAAQSAAALRAIEWGVIWLPAVGLGLSLVPVWFYDRFETLEPQMREELAQRRSAEGRA